MLLRALVLGLLSLFVLPPGQAAARNCRIVGVTDGDTLTARCGRPGAYRQIRVRIAAIDAPERSQPYGQRARQALSRLCYAEDAAIAERDTDRYGRMVADVSCRGQDAGRRMVADGWAWVYDYHGSASRRGGALFALQDAARGRRAGLWAGTDPVPPWEWRRERRETHWGDRFLVPH